jgi:regulator of protease activity HflC (stomatin/prohibitin superfamily)
MRAEIGQLTLDRTLADRVYLNKNIVDAINSAAAEWGIQCLRYEIRKYAQWNEWGICHLY